MLEQLYKSTKKVELGTGSCKGIFLASWDAVLYWSWSQASDSDFRKVFKDGTAFEMGQKGAFSGAFLAASDGRGAAYFTEGSEINIAMLDEISGLPMLGEPLNQIDMTGLVSAGSFIDQLVGSVYTPAAGNTIKVYSMTTGELIKTITVSGFSFSSTAVVLQDAGESMIFLSTPGSADVAIIDRQTGAVTFKGTIDAQNKCAVYDVLHNVVIAILKTGEVVTYGLKNVGAVLSKPTFSVPPALYTLSKVTTRLTSDDGQGVEGQGVLWWLTGDKGNLAYPVTLTDADGYAHNWYYGPAGDYGLGSETINVEVTF